MSSTRKLGTDDDHPLLVIIDAAFRLAVTAAARLYGPEAVSHSLLDMAEVVRAATEPGAH
jgi:hypothetical protein